MTYSDVTNKATNGGIPRRGKWQRDVRSSVFMRLRAAVRWDASQRPDGGSARWRMRRQGSAVQVWDANRQSTAHAQLKLDADRTQNRHPSARLELPIPYETTPSSRPRETTCLSLTQSSHGLTIASNHAVDDGSFFFFFFLVGGKKMFVIYEKESQTSYPVYYYY